MEQKVPHNSKVHRSIPKFEIIRMELPECHVSRGKNLEVVLIFVKNL